MLLTLSWRNIWRQPTRSAVIIGAVIVGLWAAIFMTGFATGVIRNFITNAIEGVVSHVQVHHPKFEEASEVQYFLDEKDPILEQLRADPRVAGLSARSKIPGMLSTAKHVQGIVIMGVEALHEASTTLLNQKIVSGKYLTGRSQRETLISRRLAEKLQADIRTKIVLSFQDVDNNMTAAAYKVLGIYDTDNNNYDDNHIFVNKEGIDELIFGTQDGHFAHEIALLAKDGEAIDQLADELRKAMPDIATKTYRELAPELDLYESQMGSISLVYIIIIMLALIFGIINTMLMAVLERYRELGILKAIGMTKTRLFAMVILETIFLSAIATPFGLALGYITIEYFGKHSIDVSRFAESFQDFGMSGIIYPEVEPFVYGQMALGIGITAILAALYPAWKAISLNPIEAIHKI